MLEPALKYMNKKRSLFNGRFFCLFVCFSFLYPSLYSQMVDAVNKELSREKSVYATWDSKTTFISNKVAVVKSVKLGFDFGGKTKLGVGYNWYKGKLSFIPDGENKDFFLKIRYVSVFAEHLYFESRRWEASIPVQLGAGILNYYDDIKNKYNKAGGLVFLYEPSSAILFKFLRYFGVGGGIGYRLVVYTGPNPNKEQMQSPIFYIRTKIYFNKIWRDLKRITKRE